MNFPLRLDIFCRVVDNFGDAGVCWRLARQLSGEHALRVRLWIDRPDVLQKICPELDVPAGGQVVSGVEVRRWQPDFADMHSGDIPDVVVEGFGCRLPEPYLSAMSKKETAPVWINMEYLTAESWADDAHAMPSPHSSLPLVKHFFFPGFSEKTGGLIREHSLSARRRAFQGDAENARAFLEGLGVRQEGYDLRLSLFCYENAPVSALFEALAVSRRRCVCLVPEGVATAAVTRFFGEAASAGMQKTAGALTVQVIPFVSQDDYDCLLWSCDLNFVRGEDSFVRALWSGKPFIWQIYPQEENAHVVKLNAFLDGYAAGLQEAAEVAVRTLYGEWNGVGTAGGHSMTTCLPSLLESLFVLEVYALRWAEIRAKNTDFAASLVRFAMSMR